MDNTRKPEQETNEEVEDLDELDEVLPSSFSITSYGADYPVDGLVKRISKKDNPSSDSLAWNRKRVNRPLDFSESLCGGSRRPTNLLESLLLGLPVPGIFLVKERMGNTSYLMANSDFAPLKAFITDYFKERNLLWIMFRNSGEKGHIRHSTLMTGADLTTALYMQLLSDKMSRRKIKLVFT